MQRMPTADFQILLALALGPANGAAIKEEVSSRTRGEIVLGPGTLYTSIRRMVDAGLLEELEAEGRQRVYRITRAGRAAAQAEAERLARDVQTARRLRLLRRPGAA
jgi:DNA-binding PadR family transcriptional regulator